MATATDVLGAVEDVLTALYPSVPVKVRKGRPGPTPESPLAGWSPGDASTVFVVSCQDPEPVDEIADFEGVWVRYEVSIAYVKPSLGVAGLREDDADVRTKRAAIRAALYKPTLSGVGSVSDVRFRSEQPYSDGAGGAPTLSVSGEVLTFLTREARGF